MKTFQLWVGLRVHKDESELLPEHITNTFQYGIDAEEWLNEPDWHPDFNRHIKRIDVYFDAGALQKGGGFV